MGWDDKLAIDYFCDCFRMYQSHREQCEYNEKTPSNLRLHDTYLALEKVNEACSNAALTKEELFKVLDNLINTIDSDEKANDKDLYQNVVKEHSQELKNKLLTGDLMFE